MGGKKDNCRLTFRFGSIIWLAFIAKTHDGKFLSPKCLGLDCLDQASCSRTIPLTHSNSLPRRHQLHSSTRKPEVTSWPFRTVPDCCTNLWPWQFLENATAHFPTFRWYSLTRPVWRRGDRCARCVESGGSKVPRFP